MTREEILKIEQAYIAAQKMSNWLYNMGQSDAKHGEDMLAMVREWDDTKTAISLLIVPRKRKP